MNALEITEETMKYRLMFGLLIVYSLFIGIGFLFEFFLPSPFQVSWVEIMKSHVPDASPGKIALWVSSQSQYSTLVFPAGLLGILLITISAFFFLFKKWVYPAILSILFYILIQGIQIEIWLAFRRNDLLGEAVLQKHFVMNSISVSIGLLAFLFLCFFIPLLKEKEPQKE